MRRSYRLRGAHRRGVRFVNTGRCAPAPPSPWSEGRSGNRLDYRRPSIGRGRSVHRGDISDDKLKSPASGRYASFQRCGSRYRQKVKDAHERRGSITAWRCRFRHAAFRPRSHHRSRGGTTITAGRRIRNADVASHPDTSGRREEHHSRGSYIGTCVPLTRPAGANRALPTGEDAGDELILDSA